MAVMSIEDSFDYVNPSGSKLLLAVITDNESS